MKTKRCASKDHKGDRTLPITEFYKNKQSSDGFHSYCKACCLQSAKRSRGKRRQRRAHRKSHLKNAYAVDPQWVQDRLELQKGRCAICRHLFTEDNAFMVDHDHETGLARGLLCRKCNTGLGYFSDRASSFIAAAVYVNTHGAIYNGPDPEEPNSNKG